MLDGLGRPGWQGTSLRQELMARNRAWARGRSHVESYGSPPVVVYAPEEGLNGEPERHGNFHEAAYAAILARPDWARRLEKVHTLGGKALPRGQAGRRWRELDSSMSSDALLMNIFCTPGVAESSRVRRAMGLDDAEGATAPVFGWKARVPLGNGRFDRTEVDMRWGGLLVEAKLTEADFQTRAAAVLNRYRDFDAVFDRELLPRVALRSARRRTAIEFAEEFTQEWESVAESDPGQSDRVAREFQAGIVARARAAEPVEAGFEGYQLIRNVLAAYAMECRFCVMYDVRRPDLQDAWFRVMAAVKPAEIRVRCQALTWQELAALLPGGLREFLESKYGILA